MNSNKKKKLEHIQVKDNGIKLSNKIGDVLNEAKLLLEQNVIDSMLKKTNETNLTRYRIAQNALLKLADRKSVV